MSRFVRASKYRHVFGQTGKKEYGYENVRISGSAWDTNVVAASGVSDHSAREETQIIHSFSQKYISVNWNASGGGAFAILPLPTPFAPVPNEIPYKLPDIIPLARSHTAPVLDTDWSPHNDSVVASGGEDGKVMIWKVEASTFEGWGQEGWVPTDFDPVARIDASPRKIGQVLFHPSASNVLASASGEHTVKLWDLANTDAPKAVLSGHNDAIQSLAFNPAGTLLVTTCRDRKLRMFDPRAGGEAVRITDGHGGIKGARVAWMGDLDRFVTTGFSKMSDRQVSIWETGSLANVKTITLDQSAGVVMPFWSDNNILFLDGNIRYYEYENDSLFALSEHKSADPQRGMCFLPRRNLSVSDCEIARAYKVAGSSVDAIAFIVPRKADNFQSDIFPPAHSSEPACDAAAFFSGKPVTPNYISLENGSSVAGTQAAPPPSGPAPAVTPAATPISRSGSVSLATPTSAAPAHSPLSARSPTPPTPAPVPIPPPASTQTSTPAPAPAPAVSSPSGDSSELEAENSRLNAELRAAREKIRNLELQVESMKANTRKAVAALSL
ncbi:hypothetical protein HWV62_29600 [Athelia sp. TMB]|nr:hypothetical protein HWV62_29600 [Athelia sp. TMB]